MFLHFLVLGACTTLLRSGHAAIVWGPCPQYDQMVSNNLKDCANVPMPLDPVNDPSGTLGTINVFVRRSYVGSAPTTNAIFGINGGPGESTHMFPAIMDAWFFPRDKTLTAYNMDVRGTYLSSRLNCSFVPPPINPYIQSTMDLTDQCNKEVINRHGPTGSDRLQYYTPYNQMMDLKYIIDQVVPLSSKDCIDKANGQPNGTVCKVSILSESVGTYNANVYLQLPGARADVVVMSCPIPPVQWALQNNPLGASLATQDNFRFCVQYSAKCKKYLGDMAHIPQLVKEGIIEKTLPCVSKLPWLQNDLGNFLTSTFTITLMMGNHNKPLVAAFWYRLYRCSDTDVDQLNFFYNLQMSQMSTTAKPLDNESNQLASHIGASEMGSFTTDMLTFDEVVNRNTRMIAIGSGDMASTFAKSVSNWPVYTPNATAYKKFASPKVPLLAMTGTLDSNTVNGLGMWQKAGLGPNAQFLSVPFLSHGMFQADMSTDCAAGIAADFIISSGTNLNTTCIASIPVPDYDGSDSYTQSSSFYYFGTRDVWNDGMVVDPATQAVQPSTFVCEAVSCPSLTCASDTNNDWSDANLDSIIAAIVVPLILIFLAMLAIVYILLTGTGKNNSGTRTAVTEMNPMTK